MEPMLGSLDEPSSGGATLSANRSTDSITGAGWHGGGGRDTGNIDVLITSMLGGLVGVGIKNCCGYLDKFP